jgi:hypothetical protein
LSPEVLARRLSRLRAFLADLRPHRDRSAEDVRSDPYEVERLLELLVQVAVDILAHRLAEPRPAPTATSVRAMAKALRITSPRRSSLVAPRAVRTPSSRLVRLNDAEGAPLGDISRSIERVAKTEAELQAERARRNANAARLPAPGRPARRA